MTSKEVLIELINLGIVHRIGEEYFITSVAEDILEKDQAIANLVIPAVTINIDELYPEPIRKASIDSKLKAIYDYCEVPYVINREGSKFMVRSNDGSTKKEVIALLSESKYKPEIILSCITDYYKFIPYPKSFKRFIGEGDLYSLYDFYAEGNKLTSEEKPDNTRWANE